MAESLTDLWLMIAAAVQRGQSAAAEGDLETAREVARVILSAGSKLHARLGILVDLSKEAGWRAEVDRAVQRQAQKPELDGQMSIADAPPQDTTRPRRRPRGKG